MRRLLGGCLALASCSEPQDEAPASASHTARMLAKPHPVEPACIGRPQPADAVTARNGPLQIAAWDDPECETLNVIATNVGDEALAVWDEPIRWAVDEGRLHAEPVPEQGIREERVASMNSSVSCHQLTSGGSFAELAGGDSFRWTVSTRQLETNDTRLLCDGHTPTWASYVLEVDAIDVTVRAGRASKLKRGRQFNGRPRDVQQGHASGADSCAREIGRV